MENNIRPWGRYDILHEEETCKVKKITVEPKGILSYQYHHKRAEQWTVISGVLTVILEGKQIVLQPGESIQIPQGAKHRCLNQGWTDACFIEVQTGTYFGEDDIIRIEDEYQRHLKPIK